MLGIFHGRGISETARVYAQIDVDMRKHIGVFNNGKNCNPLAIWLCIALHTDEGGWSWPGRDLIHAETGIGTGHAMSGALAHLRRARIEDKRIFAHYRVRDPVTRNWGQSAYLIFPDLEHPDPPFPNMEVWDPHAGNQQVGDPHAGDQHDQEDPSKVKPIEVKDCAEKTSALSPGDEAFIEGSRIEGESTLDQMTPEEKARVAAPTGADSPPEVAEPRWETMMRKGLKGLPLAGGFQTTDVIRFCARFYDLSSNPPPASPRGNTGWRSGAIQTIETFHGGLYTLYESKGAQMPDHEKQIRILHAAMDLFFVPGSGYDHIKSGTPRAMASSMPGLIGDLVEICDHHGLSGVMPDRTQIDSWIEQKERGKNGRRQAAPHVDGRVRRSDEEKAVDREAARRVLEGRGELPAGAS